MTKTQTPQPTPRTAALVGRNVRALRLARKLSQTELARRAGLTTAWLCDLEKGRRGLLLDTLATIARALNVKPARLLD